MILLVLSQEELYNFYRHQKTCKKIKKFEKRVAKAKIYLENCNLNKAFNKIIRKFKILKIL
jgi:hypothetical protein